MPAFDSTDTGSVPACAFPARRAPSSTSSVSPAAGQVVKCRTSPAPGFGGGCTCPNAASVWATTFSSGAGGLFVGSADAGEFTPTTRLAARTADIPTNRTRINTPRRVRIANRKFQGARTALAKGRRAQR
jgi:hypothetical protein